MEQKQDIWICKKCFKEDTTCKCKRDLLRFKPYRKPKNMWLKELQTDIDYFNKILEELDSNKLSDDSIKTLKNMCKYEITSAKGTKHNITWDDGK